MLCTKTHPAATRAKATIPHIPATINVIALKSVDGVLVVLICVELIDMLASVSICVVVVSICVVVVSICVDVGPVNKSRRRTEGGLNNTLWRPRRPVANEHIHGGITVTRYIIIAKQVVTTKNSRRVLVKSHLATGVSRKFSLQ